MHPGGNETRRLVLVWRAARNPTHLAAQCNEKMVADINKYPYRLQFCEFRTGFLCSSNNLDFSVGRANDLQRNEEFGQASLPAIEATAPIGSSA